MTPLSFMDEFELINGVPAFVLEADVEATQSQNRAVNSCHFTCHAFSNSGAFLAAGDDAGMIRIWGTDNFNLIKEKRHGNGHAVGCVQFFSGSEDGIVACDVFGTCEHFSLTSDRFFTWTLPSIRDIREQCFIENDDLAVEMAMDPDSHSAKIWPPCASADGRVIAQAISARTDHRSFICDACVFITRFTHQAVESATVKVEARSLVSRCSLSGNGGSLMIVYAAPLHHETAFAGSKLENCVEVWPRIPYDGSIPKSCLLPCKMGKWANEGEFTIGWTSGSTLGRNGKILVWQTATLVKHSRGGKPNPPTCAQRQLESDDTVFHIEMVSPSRGDTVGDVVLAICFAEAHDSELVIHIWDAKKNAVTLQFDTRVLFTETLVGQRQYLSVPEVMGFYWGHNDLIMEKSLIKMCISPCKNWIAFYSSESNRGYLWSLKDAIPVAKLDLPSNLADAHPRDKDPAIVSTLKSIAFNPSGNKIMLIGKGRIIAFVPAFLQEHRGLQMEHIYTSESKYVTYNSLKLSYDGSTLVLAGHEKPNNVSPISRSIGPAFLQITDNNVALSPQAMTLTDSADFKRVPKDWTLSTNGTLVACIFVDNTIAVANILSSIWDPVLQLNRFQSDRDYKIISQAKEDIFNRIFFAKLSTGHEQLVCFSLQVKGCVSWFDYTNAQFIDRIPLSVDQSLGIKLTRNGSQAIILGTQTAQKIDLENRTILQTVNYNLSIPRASQMLAATSSGEEQIFFSDTEDFEVSEDGTMVLIGWDVKNAVAIYLKPETRSKRLKRYAERMTEGINTHVWLSNDSRWALVASEQGNSTEPQKGLRIYDMHKKRESRSIPDDLDTTGCEPLFDISGDGRIIVLRSVFPRKKNETTLYDVLLVSTPYAIEGSIPDYERLRLTEKTGKPDTVTKLISDFSWPLLNYPDCENMTLFQYALTNQMPDWVSAFYELGRKEDIPINLFWHEASGETGEIVEVNALQWAIDQRSADLVWDQLTRLVNQATTVDATASILKNALPDLYNSFPAMFMKLMSSNMLIASYGQAPVAARIFEHESFLVGTDSNDINWRVQPASKVTSLWRSIGTHLQAEIVHGKKRAEVPAESKFVMVKDIAQVGMRGITRYLLMLNAPAEVFTTDIMQWTIALKWNSYGLSMCVREFILYIVFLAIFVTYALLLAKYDRFDSNEDAGYLIMIPLLVSVVFGLVNLRGEWVQLRRYEADSMQAFKDRKTGRFFYMRSQWNWIEVLSYLTMFPLPAIHLWAICSPESAGEFADHLLSGCVAFEALFLCFKVLYFAQAFRVSGPLVIAVREVVLDVLVFFGLMILILFGFSVAFLVLFRHTQEEDHRFGRIGPSMLTTYVAILGDFDIDTFREASALAWVITLFFVVYMMTMMIMLLNLLIGIMGDSFDRVRSQEKAEFLKGRAWVIDDFEAGLSETEIKELENKIGKYLHALSPLEVAQELETWAGKVKAFESVVEKKLDNTNNFVTQEISTLKNLVEELGRAAAPPT